MIIYAHSGFSRGIHESCSRLLAACIVAKSGLSCDENAAVADALATLDALAQQRTVAPIMNITWLEGSKRYKKQICSS